MRLAYLSTSALPSRSANSVHVMKMCQALSQAGHEVTLLAPSQPAVELEEVRDIHEYYGVSRDFDIVKKPFPSVPGRAAIYAAACLGTIRSMQPDLVYGRYFAAVALACLRGFPTAYESHEKLWERGRIVRALMKRVFRSPRFRQLVVISERLAEFYREAGFDPACGITVAHDAADPETTSPAEFEEGYRLHCGYVGSLFRGRGVELLLKCAAALPDCCFHLVGGSSDDVERIRSEQSGVPENVRFHGHVPPPEAARLRLGFDVLLAPYQRSVAVWGGKGDTSSFMSPLKIFEYMAAGKAVVCSDLPVLREVLDDDCSVLLPPDDPEAWIGALASLKEQPERRGALGSEALRRFEAEYTWAQRASKVVGACSDPDSLVEADAALS